MSSKPVNRRVGSAKAGSRRPNTGGRNGSQANANQKRQIVGQYMIGKTIGEGTFGKVKIAIHLPTGEKVAVKMLEKSKIKEPADIRRVNREIKILKKVRHPNVIQLYEVLDTSSAIYLIMENCEGGEMFDYIVAHRHVPEKQSCKFFHQLIDGLEAIHMNEVTHRDLKPENLLLKLSPDGWVVKIVDFGLSNTHEGNRLLSTACGSPCYAAPEMIAGKDYEGPLADIWSCGVILFALVCGYLPFEDGNTNALYQKILSGVCKPAKWISPEVNDLISKILEVDPERRYRISDIRQHPWYRSVSDEEVPRDLISSEDEENSRDQIVRTLTDAGVDMQLVSDGLASNACNGYTAMYHLLEQKAKNVLYKQRQQSQQISLGSSESPAVSTGGNVVQTVADKSAPKQTQKAAVKAAAQPAPKSVGAAHGSGASGSRNKGQQAQSRAQPPSQQVRVAQSQPPSQSAPSNANGAVKPRPGPPVVPKLAIVPEGVGASNTPVVVSQTARLPSGSGKSEFAKGPEEGSQTARPAESVDYAQAAASAIVSRVGTSDGDRPVTRRSRSRASRGTSRGGDDSMMSSCGAHSGLTGFLPPGSPGAEGSVGRPDLGPAFGDMPGNGLLQEEEESFIPITITNFAEESVVGVGTTTANSSNNNTNNNYSLPSSNAATVVINPATMPPWKEEGSPVNTVAQSSPSHRDQDQDDPFPQSRSPRDKGRDLGQVQVLPPDSIKINPKAPQNIQRSVGSSSGGRRGKNLAVANPGDFKTPVVVGGMSIAPKITPSATPAPSAPSHGHAGGRRLAPTQNNRSELMSKSPYTKPAAAGPHPLGSPNKKIVLASLNPPSQN